MLSAVPAIAPTELASLDAPVRRLFEQVASALDGPVPDMPAIGTAMVEMAADHDYLAPRLRALGDGSGSMGLHLPARGPRLLVAHRRPGEMGPIHDHGCWVALTPVTGVETHRRYRSRWSGPELARLELVTEQVLRVGQVVTMLAPEDTHAHGHPASDGAGYVLIMTGDDQRLYRRTEWDTATSRPRVLEPGDGGRWLDSEPFPG